MKHGQIYCPPTSQSIELTDMKSITDIMVLDIEVNTDSVKKLEKFLGTGKYKDLVTNTKSFSRKINEERKMRLPYVCGQVINPFK